MATSNATASADGDQGNRTEMVQSRLKQIYKKAVLPVEKRFRYDYFYESPFLSDVEFDCKCYSLFIKTIHQYCDNKHEKIIS